MIHRNIATVQRKKVVRQERLGNSKAIKVIYDDGSWGLRMNPSDSNEPLPPPGPTSYKDDSTPALPPVNINRLSPLTDPIKPVPILSPDSDQPAATQREAEALGRYLNGATNNIPMDEKFLGLKDDHQLDPEEQKAVEEAYNQLLEEQAKLQEQYKITE